MMKENRETIAAKIGERIRKFRIEQNLSQEELAFLAEIHPAYIGKVERGEKCPTIETLHKIATGLKIPLHTLTNVDTENTAAETDAFRRVKAIMDGLSPQQAARIAEIVEKISVLMNTSF